MRTKQSVFWDDLAKDLEDPEYLRTFLLESLRISTVDALINQLDEARLEKGITKAEIARKLGSEASNVRRFFAKGPINPTLSTLTEVAAALGMRVTLEPLSPEQRAQISKVLSHEIISARKISTSKEIKKTNQKDETQALSI
ncbi:MAG TPA: helix-turn-helix transcriptional regulator [Candidatus Paceibacterota bacterium]|nr:helix-turn-helix transcriptional regulator [Candidatus Paceibacterota bacterium]